LAFADHEEASAQADAWHEVPGKADFQSRQGQ